MRTSRVVPWFKWPRPFRFLLVVSILLLLPLPALAQSRMGASLLERMLAQRVHLAVVAEEMGLSELEAARAFGYGEFRAAALDADLVFATCVAFDVELRGDAPAIGLDAAALEEHAGQQAAVFLLLPFCADAGTSEAGEGRLVVTIHVNALGGSSGSGADVAYNVDAATRLETGADLFAAREDATFSYYTFATFGFADGAALQREVEGHIRDIVRGLGQKLVFAAQ